MELTWGFLVFMAIFLIPGFLIRRLYFHDEFSKQFRYGEPLLKTIFYSLICGIINAMLGLFIYDTVFSEIDLDRVVAIYKSFSIEGTQIQEGTLEKPVKAMLFKEALPFIGFLWVTATLIGLVSGRFVHKLGLDSRWSVLRFRNPWFYLFNGHRVNLKKFRFLRIRQARTARAKGRHWQFLFTNVDVLTNVGGKAELFSGILVDYELDAGNSQELSKVVLRKASRYLEGDRAKDAISIPGDLFVLDCAGMCNLNIRYVYGYSGRVKGSRTARIVYNSFALLSLLCIPAFIFRIDLVMWEPYVSYFEKSVVGKIFYYLFCLQVLHLANFFTYDTKKKLYRTLTGREWIAKVSMLIAIYYFSLVMEWVSQEVLSWF